MKESQLSIDETRDMFIHVSKKIEVSKDRLTQADKAIGDGDHGVGMARGFLAVKEKIEGKSFSSIGDLLSTIGMTLMTSIGGAAGAIFGTLFREGAKNLKDKEIFNASVLITMLSDGLEAVKQRGKAEIGDKTMVDALEPAVQKIKEYKNDSLKDALVVASEGARLGMEKTKDMIATIGKAKTLGERAIGHVDPGAISIYLILKFMTEYVSM
ncbi:MAG: dihydroxyacetone kinase subunit L [Candidatus Helarchaeota archaeon]|nr:dihydroxyacetone kinase subunit L [Candidatus Helarchaeota archaeon]